MEYLKFEDLEPYEPAGHTGVINHLLVGMENLSVSDVSIWHGRLYPGGRADLHTHPGSLQIYVGLVGTMLVGDGRREEDLGTLGTALFEPGEHHFIENRGDDDAEVLVISVPGLR